MLSRAVVVESRRSLAGFSEDLCAALGRRLVGTAREIAFFETDVVEHPLDESYVLRLTAV
jgi:hypothetical protein